MKKDDNRFGVASLVLGILSLVPYLGSFLGVVMGPLAIIFAVKQNRMGSNGITTAGMVTGIIGTVLSGLVWIVLILAVGISAFLYPTY